MEVKEYLRDLKISKCVFALFFSNYQYLREDLIQESLLALWRSRNRYDEKRGSYSNFAFNVAFNAMTSFVRKESKHINYEDLPNDLIDVSFDIESYLDLRIQIENRLKRVPKYRACVVEFLSYVVAGYTFEEIAKITNYSCSYIKRVVRDFRYLLNTDLFCDFNCEK